MAPSFSADVAMSDREAIKVIESQFSSYISRGTATPIGSYRVVLDQNRGAPGSVTESMYMWIQAAAKAGYVSLSVEPNSQGFTWEQGKILAKITVRPTDSSRDRVDPKNPGSIRVPYGARFFNIEIVSNEAKTVGVNQFRLLLVRYDAEWSPAAQQHAAWKKDALDRKRKGAVLVKWDAFEKAWRFEREAYANASAELDMSEISAVLARGR